MGGGTMSGSPSVISCGSGSIMGGGGAEKDAVGVRRCRREVDTCADDTLTCRYTRGKRHDQNLRVREAISQPVRRCRYARARYRTRFRPN